MAFTISDGQLAVLLRVATNADSVPEPIALAIKFLSLAAKEIILKHAPLAPDSVHDAALVRLAGFLYDNDPTDPVTPNPMRTSGTAALLAPFRDIGLGTINPPDTVPAPAGTGVTVPSPPPDGFFMLRAFNGALDWVSFPPDRETFES